MTKGLLIAAGLAGTAGYVNAVAFLGLHAFVAPMTGTVVLAGFALAIVLLYSRDAVPFLYFQF